MPCTKTSSKKSKGRKLQKTIRDWLIKIGKTYGLQVDDIKSTSMGASGVDVQLSPAANQVFGRLAIECKNVEALNVVTTFHEHAAKYEGHIPMLFHKKNKTDVLVTLRLKDFELYFKESIDNILYSGLKREPIKTN